MSQNDVCIDFHDWPHYIELVGNDVLINSDQNIMIFSQWPILDGKFAQLIKGVFLLK